MTTPKPQKDKNWLTPRPTAASAARAARNATNRNLTVTPAHRQSPNRPPVSPTMKVNLKSESAVFENYVDNNLDQLEDKPVDREDGTATPENENIDQFGTLRLFYQTPYNF
ncbi:hypothetical protein MSG28_001507 [Choristoneura fumiferana]|uniref:Uncharacterized protein n=1 Tax=Choristoneura fumiferana TaxID=7141 RepID=A0ACC0KUW9_CHOFU|nr:hypothetical protein MSG28_001507 [Choristoneura fumiferana]